VDCGNKSLVEIQVRIQVLWHRNVTIDAGADNKDKNKPDEDGFTDTQFCNVHLYLLAHGLSQPSFSLLSEAWPEPKIIEHRLRR